MQDLKILVVDDRPANLLSFEALLVDTDYQIVSAGSGEEALKALLKDDFAIIILDVQMQTMDGFETAALIRAREKSKDTPIIFITAFNQTDEHMLRGYALGAVDYLFKPITPEILKAKVGVFADLFRKNQQLRYQAEQIEAANSALQSQLEQVRLLNMELKSANQTMEVEIARRIEAERAVQNSEKLYRTLAQYLPKTAVVLFDRDIRFLLVDGGLLDSGEYSRHEVQKLLEGKTMRETLPPEVCNWLEPYCRAGIEGNPISFEWPIDESTLSVQLLPVKDENGLIFAGLGMIQDITEAKRAEQILGQSRDLLEGMVQERTQALEQQNQKLALLNEAGQVLIGILNQDEILKHLMTIAASLVDAENCAVCLWNEDQKRLNCGGILVGDYDSNYLLSATDGLLGHVMQNRESVIVTVKTTELTDYHKLHFFPEFKGGSLLAVPLHSPNGVRGILTLLSSNEDAFNNEDQVLIETLTATASVALDNARLFAAEALARKEAEQANDIKLKFLATISHELRTPLTSIKGFATTLLATDVNWDSTSQRDFVAIINEESDKLTELIEQLLDLSRLQAGTLRIHPEPCTLSTIITTAMAQLEALTMLHQLHINIPLDLPLVMADIQRIAGVLVNLVGNAAKYAPPNTQITIAASRQADCIQVNVSDEGPGIPPENREKVFEAFWQLPASAKTNGIGLGLAICRGLITAHGGKIWVMDTTTGTTIAFTLPIAPD